RVGGQEVRVDFWDTAGQERFRSMHASYYHQAHACIMVFDVQRKVTYKNLNSWYKELREFRPEIPCIVVANKIDADMKVTQKSFNFARKFSLPFYFVSAADGTNVVKLFNDAIRLAVAYKQHSGDFMDEVLRELEVGRALSLLSPESCQMSSSALFPLWQRGETAAREALPSACDPGGFVCCSCLGWEGGSGNHHKSSHCPRRSLKGPQQIQLLQSLSFLSSSLSCSFPEL
uniref:Rab-like protein 2A n=1 Tax=Cyanistes caeruleus TaxID=156563 RepID=A0A8C0UBP6_CYACU